MMADSQRQAKLVEVFDHEKYYPIVETLSSFLTIADFLTLCRVCKGLDNLKNHMLEKVYDINQKLRDFFDDPVTFRSQQGKLGAVISGAFALDTFELGRRKALYLDVFIKDGTYAEQFTSYIREAENYQEDDQGSRTVKEHSLNVYCSSLLIRL